MAHAITAQWNRVTRLQPMIWTAICALYFAIDQANQPDPDHRELLIRAIWWAAIGGVVSTGLVALYDRLGLSARGLLVAGGVALIGAIASTVAWLVAFNLLDGAIELEGGYQPITAWTAHQVAIELTSCGVAMAIWHGGAFLYLQLRSASLARERALRAEHLADQARMRMLRSQLQPHFLFNALNSAIAMIEVDPAGAQEMLTRLASLLRATLDQPSLDPPSLDPPAAAPAVDRVLLSAELRVLRQYLSIEKVRYEDKLIIDEQVAPGALSARLPSLMLLPLVDNAIKHGMRTSPMPLRVELAAAATERALEVRISNTGRLVDSSRDREDTGLGIELVRQRLRSEFAGRAAFELSEASGWVHATLRVPIERTDAREDSP